MPLDSHDGGGGCDKIRDSSWNARTDFFDTRNGRATN